MADFKDPAPPFPFPPMGRAAEPLTSSVDMEAFETVCAERDLLAARLQQWRTWAQFVFNGGGAPRATDAELQRDVCARYDADVAAKAQD